MKILYSLQETANGIKNTKLSHTISILIISFLLLILSVVFIASLNINRITEILNAERDIQVFLSNTLDEQEIMLLHQKLTDNPAVKNVDYISKEQAAEEFEQEFGESIIEALGENPLPASFRISLENQTSDSPTLNEFAKTLQAMPEVDEIVSEHSSFTQLAYFARLSKRVLWLLFIMVALVSLFVISNTIRLIISNRQHIIETMRLVGATHRFIRFPYLLQGAIQGLLGGLLTFLTLLFLLFVVDRYWPGIIWVSRTHLSFVILVGFFLGLGGSLVSIRKFLTL